MFPGLNVTESADKQANLGPDVAPRLEKLLNEHTGFTHQQKDKIKIAFAEGYLAGLFHFHWSIRQQCHHCYSPIGGERGH